MALSGSTSYNLTAIEIVNRAFAKIHVKKAETTLQPDELQDGLDSLNMMIKAWSAQGLHLWAKDEGIAFLSPGKSSYNLGATGDEACQFDDFVGTR